MEPEPSAAGGGSYLIDRVAYVLPFGVLGRWIAGGWARRKIDRMFEYRHAVTLAALGAASVPTSATGSAVDP